MFIVQYQSISSYKLSSHKRVMKNFVLFLIIYFVLTGFCVIMVNEMLCAFWKIEKVSIKVAQNIYFIFLSCFSLLIFIYLVHSMKITFINIKMIPVFLLLMIFITLTLSIFAFDPFIYYTKDLYALNEELNSNNQAILYQISIPKFQKISTIYDISNVDELKKTLKNIYTTANKEVNGCMFFKNQYKDGNLNIEIDDIVKKLKPYLNHRVISPMRMIESFIKVSMCPLYLLSDFKYWEKLLLSLCILLIIVSLKAWNLCIMFLIYCVLLMFMTFIKVNFDEDFDLLNEFSIMFGTVSGINLMRAHCVGLKDVKRLFKR